MRDYPVLLPQQMHLGVLLHSRSNFRSLPNFHVREGRELVADENFQAVKVHEVILVSLGIG